MSDQRKLKPELEAEDPEMSEHHTKDSQIGSGKGGSRCFWGGGKCQSENKRIKGEASTIADKWCFTHHQPHLFLTLLYTFFTRFYFPLFLLSGFWIKCLFKKNQIKISGQSTALCLQPIQKDKDQCPFQLKTGGLFSKWTISEGIWTQGHLCMEVPITVIQFKLKHWLIRFFLLLSPTFLDSLQKIVEGRQEILEFLADKIDQSRIRDL